MPLPVVSGSFVETPSSGVKINGAAFRNAALAPGQVAGAAGQDVGGFFSDVAQKFQDNQNARIVFENDTKLRKASEENRLWQAQNPDEHTWIPHFQELSGELKEQVLNDPNAGPDVKRQLNQMFTRWETANAGEVKLAAQLKSLNRTQQAADTAAKEAALGGDLKGVKDIYDSAVENHAYSRAEADIKIKAATVTAYESQANIAISSDPEHAPETIENTLKGKLPEGRYRVIHHVAQQAQKEARAENAQEIDNQIDDNPLHTYDPAKLKAERDAGHISGSDYEKITRRIANYGKADKQREKDDWNVAMMEADKPPTDPAQLKGWAADVKSLGLEWNNPALRRMLNERVDAQVKSMQKTGESAEKPIHRTQLDYMRQIGDERMGLVPTGSGGGHNAPPYVRGGLKAVDTMPDDIFKQTFGRKTTRDTVRRDFAAFQEAQRNRLAEATQKYREWSQTEKGQKATPTEAAAERERLGYGQYETAADVKFALQHQQIDRATAKQILANQFGIQ